MDSPTFADLGLSPKVYEAVTAAGYTSPTPIQAEAIPVAVTGQDVLGIAQTGTGKTASFTLPMITRLETGRARARMPRSLILAPTRELAAQVAEAFEKYGVNHKLNLALLIGGVSFVEQDRKIDRGVDVLIATPGRLLDHFQRGKLLLNSVEILVIDEADRMLDMGFIPDIERICSVLPPRRQTLFFSATMPPEIQRLVDKFLNTPVRIEVARPATTAQTITQRFKFCPEGDDWAKREMLRSLIRQQDVKNAIIFCNRKRDVAVLHKSLVKHGFNAGALHGDMDQRSRTETLDRFRSGEILFLAASDVAARGLDIPEVSHVFNFDVPMAGDDYVHRIGRTGRAGHKGFAGTIVTADDLKMLGEIAKATGEEPQWLGEEPSEDDYASAGKRHKGRGGRSRSSSSTSTRRRSVETQSSSEKTAPDDTGEPDASNDNAPSQTGEGKGRRSRGRGRSRRAQRNDQLSTETDAQQAKQADDRSRKSGGQRDAAASTSEPDVRNTQRDRSRRDRDNNNNRPARGSRGRGRDTPAGGPNAFEEDTIPAFLQRPVRPAKPSSASASESDAEPVTNAEDELACD